MDTLQWLTETEFGKCIFTMLVSMVPIIELRGGLPFGVALGLPYPPGFSRGGDRQSDPRSLYHRLYPPDL